MTAVLFCSNKNNNHPNETSATATTTAWSQMARQIAICLLETVSTTAPKELLSTGGRFEGTSTGWANWIEEATALELQSTILDKLELFTTTTGTHGGSSGSSRSANNDFFLTRSWLRWMQNSPDPYVWDISLPLRHEIKKHILGQWRRQR